MHYPGARQMFVSALISFAASGVAPTITQGQDVPASSTQQTQPNQEEKSAQQALRIEETQVTAEREQERGYAVQNAASATKTDTPIFDLPVSIQVVPREVIEDQQVIRLQDVTGIGFDSDTQVNHYEQQRLSIAPAFTWQPTGDTTLTILSNYQYDPQVGFYNLMPARGMVLPNVVKIPRDFDPGDPSFNKYRKENSSIGYAFEHRFNDVWSVEQNFRYLNNDAYLRGVFADDGLTEDGTALNRFAFFNDGYFSNILVDTQAHAQFATGPLRHQTTIGLDYQRNRERHIFKGNFSTPPISIVDPVYGQDIPNPDFLFFTSSKNREQQIGFYAQEQIKLGNWALLIGGRQDWLDAQSKSLKSLETTRQTDDKFTWRVGLVYLSDIGFAPYFSYSSSSLLERATNWCRGTLRGPNVWRCNQHLHSAIVYVVRCGSPL